jgi:thiol-disulfide isomerase/thioredoxin
MSEGRRIKSSTIAVGLVVLGVAVAVAATRLSFLQGAPPKGSTRHDPAPEFTGIDAWVNSDPLTISSLRGRVVLIDFWTYTCINCVRTFPALRAMYDRYHAAGLEIVGVHSPEFSFEMKLQNVREAVDRNDLPWPVALDNKMATWNVYQNHYWPHVYLIDANGQIRFDKIGEGDDELIQTRLRALLTESHATLPAPVDFSVDLPGRNITPEIYAGFERGAPAGTIANPEGYHPGAVVDYKPVDARTLASASPEGTFFLEGRWKVTSEYAEAVEDGAKLDLPYYARDVFMVAAAPEGATVGLELNGKPVPESVRGSDAGSGSVRVTFSNLYRLIHGPAAKGGRLTLTAGKGFRLYTFTFG